MVDRTKNLIIRHERSSSEFLISKANTFLYMTKQYCSPITLCKNLINHLKQYESAVSFTGLGVDYDRGIFNQNIVNYNVAILFIDIIFDYKWTSIGCCRTMISTRAIVKHYDAIFFIWCTVKCYLRWHSLDIPSNVMTQCYSLNKPSSVMTQLLSGYIVKCYDAMLFTGYTVKCYGTTLFTGYIVKCYDVMLFNGYTVKFYDTTLFTGYIVKCYGAMLFTGNNVQYDRGV